jgi:plasmid stabilization system protein ParE
VNKPIRIEPEAAAELDEAARWYEQRQPGLGVRYLHTIDSTLQQIQRTPHAGARAPRVPPDLLIRRVPVRGFPYLIVYLEALEAVRILAFTHERRRPGYWLTRA